AMTYPLLSRIHHKCLTVSRLGLFAAGASGRGRAAEAANRAGGAAERRPQPMGSLGLALRHRVPPTDAPGWLRLPRSTEDVSVSAPPWRAPALRDRLIVRGIPEAAA